MAPLSDDALRALIRTDPERGWRAFIDQYTPLMLGLIRRAGLVDRDEAMEIYVLMCEQLSARGCERLQSQDAARGSIGGWLAVLARHAAVDWVRSRKGRRRLFQAVKELPRLDQRVFELYYWDDRSPSEIAELLPQEVGCPADLSTVLDALARIQNCLTDRHRAELMALAVRSRAPLAIDDTDAHDTVSDTSSDPEITARATETNARFNRALASLSAEDAAIVRLKIVDGLSNRDVEHALGLGTLTANRIQEILARLRESLTAAGIGVADAAFIQTAALDRGQP